MTTISRHANAQPKTPPKKAEPKSSFEISPDAFTNTAKANAPAHKTPANSHANAHRPSPPIDRTKYYNPVKALPPKPAAQKTDPKCEYVWGNKNNGYSVEGSGAKVCSYSKHTRADDASNKFLNRTTIVSPEASSKIGSIPSVKFNAQPKVSIIKSKGPDGKEVAYKVSTHVNTQIKEEGSGILGWKPNIFGWTPGVEKKEHVTRFTKSEQILGVKDGKTQYGTTQAWTSTNGGAAQKLTHMQDSTVTKESK